ncbi:MAG TPA: porin [Caulobacteraceae bacterium]|jgi:phosphate-selective porin OprO/OprP
MQGTRAIKAGLAAGAGLGALIAAQSALAAPASSEDARIAKLEAAVATLQAEVAQTQQLTQQNAALQGQVSQLQGAASENAELKQEVGQLQAQVADLKATTVAQISDVRQAQAAAPTVAFPGGRPTFATPDGKFTASLRGQLQLDTAAYFQPGAGPIGTDLRRDGPALGSSATNVDLAHARDLKDGTVWRRARVGLEGTAYSDWDYRLLVDFGGSGVENAGQLYEAWLQYSGFKPFHARIGAWSQPIGLEDGGNTNTQMFLERPAISDLARGLAAGDTRIGAGVFGYTSDWFLSSDITGRTIGVVNTGTAITSTTSGNTGTAQSFGDQIGYVGRADYSFHGGDWRVLGGVHGSYVIHPADSVGPSATGALAVNDFLVTLKDTPELRVDGTQFINTGAIDASHASTIGAEFAAQKGPFFVQGEYESIHVNRTDPGTDSPTFWGWYAEGSVFLTGESRQYTASSATFDGPAIKRPFSLKNGGPGAWEFVARYDDADLNFEAGPPGNAPSASTIRGGDEQVWALGLNWYPVSAVKFGFDIDRVMLERLSPNATNFQTPTGAEIGQAYTALAVRSQVAF